MNINRINYIFSYWIFIWYVLYELKLTKYNPNFALSLGLIENIFTLMLMLYYSNSIKHILSFCIIIFSIKIIPLWRLRNTTFEIENLYATLFLFAIFLLWLFINNINIIEYYKSKLSSLKKDKTIGPFMDLVDKYL